MSVVEKIGGSSGVSTGQDKDTILYKRRPVPNKKAKVTRQLPFRSNTFSPQRFIFSINDIKNSVAKLVPSLITDVSIRFGGPLHNSQLVDLIDLMVCAYLDTQVGDKLDNNFKSILDHRISELSTTELYQSVLLKLNSYSMPDPEIKKKVVESKKSAKTVLDITSEVHE